MADLGSLSYETTPAGSPHWQHDVDYSIIGRDGAGISYNFLVYLGLTSGSYAYGTYTRCRVTVNGITSAWLTFPGGNTWGLYETRSCSFNLGFACGAGGGLFSASVEWNVNYGGVTSPNWTGGGEVTVSNFNTPPYYIGGDALTTNLSGIIPENTASLVCTWPVLHDAEGGALNYQLQRELNNSGNWVILYQGSALSFSDNIGAGNPSQVIRYMVSGYDAYGAWATSWLYTGYITKSVFTKANLTSADSFLYSDGLIAFTIAGASNTNGNTTFTYSLACPGLTTVAPTAGAYNFSATLAQVKAIIGSAQGYVGSLTFTLTTTNAYGTAGTSTVNIPVDLRTAPRVLTAGVTTPNTGITAPANGAYVVGGTWYFVPNRKKIEANWGRSVDELGGLITYDVSVSIAGGAYTLVASDLPDVATMTYSFNLSAPSALSTCIVKVTAKTSYGTIRDTLAASINIHYYNPSTITFALVNRLQLSAVVSGTIQKNTSITTGLTISTPTFQFAGGTVTNAVGTLPAFSATLTLTAIQTGSFVLTVKDTASIALEVSLGALSTILAQAVSAYIPMLAPRSWGIGVNAIPVNDGVTRLTVGGGLNVAGVVTYQSLDSNIIIASTDMNNLKSNGLWYCPSNATVATLLNCPTAQAFSLLIEEHAGTKQTLTEYQTTSQPKIWVRNFYSAVWGVWYEVVIKDSLGYINNSYFKSTRVDDALTALSYLYDSGDGYLRKKTLANARTEMLASHILQNGWIPATFQNGWIRYGDYSYFGGDYMKDAHGFVHIRGMISSGAITSGAVIFNLPAGYRPASSWMFICNVNSVLGSIHVDNNGNVCVQQMASNGWVSISGFMFPAEL